MLVYVFLKVKKEVVFEILEKIIFIKVCLVLKFVMEVVLKNNWFDMLELIIEELFFDFKRILEVIFLVLEKFENNELEVV